MRHRAGSGGRTQRGALPVLAALLAGLLAAAAVAAADLPATPAPAPARPRIALVLAGGGAKGGAHIGVLKVLEEMHVPVDCIAGTSMGSLVGGGYAAGMSADDIEKFVTHIDWRKVIGGVGDRELEPAEQKRMAGPSSVRFEFAVKHGKIFTPQGLIQTSSIESVLRAYVARARTVENFDRLPIPYRAVSTDMLSGTMVVLSQGDIANAMRASMAIPGVFAPVVTDKYVLADGMVVRNLPVDVGRKLCGDVVIAVNIVKPVVTREQVGGALQLAARSMDVMIEANERTQLDTLGPQDVRIDVDVGDIGAGNFERTAETIPLGEAAARKASAQLAALALPPEQYAAWRAHVDTRQGIDTTVSEVQFAGLTRVNPEYLRSLTRIRAGDRVNGDAISEDARRMAVLDDVTSVDYELTGDPDRPVLLWRPQEDPYGPDYLRLNLGLYMGGAGDSDFVLGLRHVRYWLNEYGGQWRNAVQVGTYALLDTNLYQPVNVRQTLFVLPDAFISRSVEDLFNNGQRVARYLFIDRGMKLDAGANFGLDTQVRLGYWIDKRDTEIDTGLTIFPTVSAVDAGPSAFVSYDSRNAAAFATDGMVAAASFLGSDGTLGGTRDWEKVEAAVRAPVVVRKLRIWLTAAGGTEIGTDLPPDRAFALGGPQSFPGYAEDQLRARKYWIASGNFLYPIASLVMLRDQSLYGGVNFEAGDLYDRVDPVPNGRVYSVAAYFGGRTPIGNVSFGFAGAGGTTHGWGLWLSFGRSIGHGSILNDDLFR